MEDLTIESNGLEVLMAVRQHQASVLLRSGVIKKIISAESGHRVIPRESLPLVLGSQMGNTRHLFIGFRVANPDGIKTKLVPVGVVDMPNTIASPLAPFSNEDLTVVDGLFGELEELTVCGRVKGYNLETGELHDK